MISFSKKFVFMHIPRTAGSSVERSVLEPYAYYFEKDRDNLLMEKNFSEILDQNISYGQGGDFLGRHFTIRDYHVAFTNSEDFDNYFDRDSYVNLQSNPLDHFYKFTVVRNPWDRFVSYYLDNVGEQSEENFADFASLAGSVHDASSPKSYLKQPKSVNLLSQSQWIFDKKSKLLELDKIARFEDLENGFKEICQDLDVEHEALPHLGETEGREHYSKYYNGSTKDLIAEAWAEDIKNFGYEYEAV
jgi:hypothetical protein